MPEIDGYTATRAVRQREVAAGHRTTIIGITAHAMADDRDECIAAGMDDYLAKPVMPEELAAALDKWVLTMHGAGAVAQFQAAGASPAVSAAETPVLDWRTLAELRECQRLGESDFVQRLIDVFLSDLARQIQAIRNSIEAGAAERVSQAAHALKGACAELGAREMQALCEWLESHAHQGLPDGTQEIIEHFDREAERLRQALTTERTRLSE